MTEQVPSKDLVAAWITSKFGERCKAAVIGCCTCMVWREFDETTWASHEPGPARNELAWLIEVPFDGKAHWWYGSDFTDDANQAVRFSRSQDAEQVILERGLVDAVPTEHMWCSDPPPPAEQA